ncbi:MAG: insulinase family protein [Streptosporangiales bacterium]|nr:insulinase family protein [Streptosporangiales bacterium]
MSTEQDLGAPLPASEQEPDSTITLLPAREGSGVVRRTVLPGGLRIVTETVPSVRSVTVGIWTGVGSRDETRPLAGATHYLEHLLFKGTKRRSALDLAAAMDAVGGEMNAFTAKEYTCYYARVLDSDLSLALDLLSDMVTSSVLDPAEVEAERGVILEEIAMHDDDPTDAVHDHFAEAFFGDAPLGRPVQGTVDSIRSLGRSRILGYYRRRYRPENMVVSVAGNLEHEGVVELVREAFSRADELGDPDMRPSPPRIGGRPWRARRSVRSLHRDTEQANLILGTTGVSRNDDRRFALGVLNAALGGGMSSRLFQEIREKRGLAYAVYSYTAQYADTGIAGVYVGCLPAKIDEVLKICREELHKAAGNGISEEELARGKGQLRGSFVLGLEDTGSRMSRIGKSELVYETLPSADEILARIDAVTLDDVRAVAQDFFTQPQTLAVIGPFGERDFSDAVA